MYLVADIKCNLFFFFFWKIFDLLCPKKIIIKKDKTTSRKDRYGPHEKFYFRKREFDLILKVLYNFPSANKVDLKQSQIYNKIEEVKKRHFRNKQNK